MRELKFRAWSDKYGMYKVGCLVTEKGTGDFKPDDRNFICVHMLYQSFFIIEQFTGLHDKNGKEIYEGDIVKMPDWWVESKYEKVRFTKLSCGFEPFVNGCFECMSPVGEEVEVVGNIHENKDLLEYIEKDQKTE